MGAALRIGVTGFPTLGGSGVVATELGLALARRGHAVHFVCAGLPRRLELPVERVGFHEVRAREYYVFSEPPRELALASAMVRVAGEQRLDLLHVHYAVPHAASAWMAREALGGRIRVVTTLHGTDVTLVGADESYRSITRHALLRCDAITAPSAWLADEARRRFELPGPVEVIPNFVDPRVWRPREGADRPRLAALFGPAARTTPVLVHVSNYRPLKRVDRVVDVFARVVTRRPALLLLIGEGPERPAVEAALRARGLADRAVLLDEQEHVEDLLRECAAFLLPSDGESFGLAALEALASGVPVVASRVGGVPELVRDGDTGFLLAPDDADGMAARVLDVLDTPAMAVAARADALSRFRVETAVERYEALYARVLRG